MKNILIPTLVLLLALFSACSGDSNKDFVDEDSLGLIYADLRSRDTELPEKAPENDLKPGGTPHIDRAYENAPPQIPHTTEGFLPIKASNNICMGCHMPHKAAESGATPISNTHFQSLRPQPKLVDGKYVLPAPETHIQQDLDHFNNLYFNCSQCHVAQTRVTVAIENSFTAEFREQYNLSKSDLKDKVYEGVK